VVQYVQGTATDAPTIAPGPVMHSCPQHQNGGSASLGVWEGWPGVRECWAGAGQASVCPGACLGALHLHERSQLHASHASRDTQKQRPQLFFTLSLLAASPHWRKKARRVGVDCGSWKTLGPSPSTTGSTVGQMFARASGAVLKEANRAPYKQPAPSWLSG
jgi:hypothetical protein